MIELSMTITCTRCGHTETFTEPYKRLYETEFVTKARHAFFDHMLVCNQPHIGVWKEIDMGEGEHLCEKCGDIADKMSEDYNKNFREWVARGGKDEPVDQG